MCLDSLECGLVEHLAVLCHRCVLFILSSTMSVIARHCDDVQAARSCAEDEERKSPSRGGPVTPSCTTSERANLA